MLTTIEPPTFLDFTRALVILGSLSLPSLYYLCLFIIHAVLQTDVGLPTC